MPSFQLCAAIIGTTRLPARGSGGHRPGAPVIAALCWRDEGGVHPCRSDAAPDGGSRLLARFAGAAVPSEVRCNGSAATL